MYFGTDGQLVDAIRGPEASGPARGWDRVHEPKNLLLALTAELGELTELFSRRIRRRRTVAARSWPCGPRSVCRSPAGEPVLVSVDRTLADRHPDGKVRVRPVNPTTIRNRPPGAAPVTRDHGTSR